MPVSDPWLATGSPTPTVRDATPIKVYRYNPGMGSPFEPMPSLRCLTIRRVAGPEPSTATFRFAFDGADADSPQDATAAISTGNTLPKNVQIGDRLLVQATRPDGTDVWIFDGFPLLWRVVLRGRVEAVIMTARGVETRCRDKLIPGQLLRKAGAPSTANSEVQTDIVAQFNPRGVNNASVLGHDSGTAPNTYPVFVDVLTVRSPDTRRQWDLAMATRHILINNNPENFVKNPDFAATDALLVTREPIDGTPFDPTNTATFTPTPIAVPDTPLTGRDWPGAWHEMIRDYGFEFRYDLSTADDGTPQTKIVPYLPQIQTAKPLALQARGAALDPALSNVHDLDAARDLGGVANQWRVIGALKRWEVSVVLFPGFPMATADGATIGAIKAFDKSSGTYDTTNHDAYRLYVLDETGEGHYPPGSATVDQTIPSLDALFGAGKYTQRRRKPIGDLLKLDANHKPLRHRLHIARGYAQLQPGLWQPGSEVWQPVEGGYELLKDRVGIRINADNPNGWKVGPTADTTAPYPLGVVKGVEDQATAGNTNFLLLLTIVVEADETLQGKADRRTNSPLTDIIERQVDARDRYQYAAQAPNSWYNRTAAAVVVRDDTDAATAEAIAVRATTEAGVLDADVTIPRFTAHYQIGDRISQLEGRGIDFRTNTGGAADDAAVYPVVTSVTHTLDGRQETHLSLSDAGMERGRYKAAISKGHGHVKR